MKYKRGQLKISFGMIVSVILIAVFIAVAFYAISKFLGWQRVIQIGQFTDELQYDIDKIWKGSQGSQTVSYSLPGKIEKICLTDFDSPPRGIDGDKYSELQRGFYGSENLVFYPTSSGEGMTIPKINHIDLEKITGKNNPFCIDNKNGKVDLIISMEFGESLVTITK